MADDRSEKPKPSWKRGTRPTVRPNQSDHLWKQRKASPTVATAAPRTWIYKVAGGVLGFLGALVLVVILIVLFVPPKPVGVVLIGADYANNLAVPQNVLGWRGLKGIETLLKTPRRWSLLTPASLRLVSEPKTLETKDDWDLLIKDLKTKGLSQNKILFVVALHGGSDARGAYLMPNQMAAPEDALLLSHVIESMAQFPDDKQKILILEGAQVRADWRLGMLDNRFVSGLKAQEPAIRKVKNLWVLSGCDEEQRCWGSEGLGRTVFTHYLIDALRGRAAGPGAPFTLEDLAKHVRRNVASWAWNARGAIQEPLLLPGSGANPDDAKRLAPKAVRLATIDGAPDPVPTPEMDRAALTEAWKRFHELDRSVYRPSFFAPRRWREYRARLVRSEELARAGATDQAAASLEQLRVLDSRLRTDLYLKKLSGSIENTLTINVAQGGAVEAATATAPEFVPFWQAQTRPEAVKEWDKIQTSQAARSGDGSQSVRCRVDDFLLQLAAKDPWNNLKTAADRLKVVKAPEYPQPAEAHFVSMLQKFLVEEGNSRPAESPFWRVVEQAIKLRRDAEHAALGLSEQPGEYPYCEQVQPWIKAQIDKADELRRAGEDRLFSSEEQAWDQSREAFQQARAFYRQARDDAAAVRSALAARDRLLAGLPDFSRWLSQRHSDLFEDGLLKEVEDLWSETHELTELLETPEEAVPVKLAQRSLHLGKGYDALIERFNDQKSKLERTRSQEDWVSYSAAAAVPFPDTPDLTLRTKIWDRLDVIRKSDFELYTKPESSEPTRDDRAYARKRLDKRVQIEGRMALAALGPRWFDDKTVGNDPEQGDYTKNLDRVQSAIPEEETEIAGWVKGLEKAGLAIGQRWRRLTVEIDKLVDEPNGVPDDLVAFQTRLKKADRLGRLLDSGASVLNESKGEATALYRRSMVHDLLLWMAERTWRDHWYDEDPRGMKPYYQVAGARFVNDAAEVLAETAAVKKTRELLARPGQFELEGPGPLVLTSERSLAASFRVVAAESLPAGSPAIKPTVAPALRLDGGPPGYRSVDLHDGGDSIRLNVSPTLPPENEFDPLVVKPRIDPARLSVAGWFRGQTFEASTTVSVHLLPEVIAIGSPPPDPPLASLTVRADPAVISRFGEGTGAVAIILDCSGSMALDVTTFQQFHNLPSKFREAKQALNRVLETIPEGTVVSLWIFGQAREGLLDINQKPPRQDDVFDQNDPTRTIRRLRPPSPWRREEREPLARQLDQLWPFHGTPLIETMRRARDDLLQAKGLKTLLVLTDGNDSEFAKQDIVDKVTLERSKEGRDKVHAFLRQQFDQQGVSVNMVFFKVENPKEYKQAVESFGVVRTLDPPGQFYQVENLQDLVLALTRLIRQKLTCVIIKPGSEQPQGVVDVTNPSEADQWWDKGLEPGLYSLRVRADQTYSQEAELARGDRMVVRLVEGPTGGLAFERALYSDDFPEAVKHDGGRARLSVLADVSQDDQGNGLRMLVGLESLDNRGPRLRQVRPRWAWFELAPKDAQGEPTFALRWRERAFFPAPVWQLDVPRWVADPGGAGLAQPVVNVDWSANPDLAHAVLDLIAFRTFEAVDHHELRLADGKPVIVESLRLEDHGVEHKAGDAPVSEHCLVVRIDYGKAGGPVLVDPEGLRLYGIDVVGYEHRIYSRARKYAGLFWPVTRDQINKLKSLNLISVARMRAEAGTRKEMLECTNLPRPAVGGKVPQPPDALLLAK